MTRTGPDVEKIKKEVMSWVEQRMKDGEDNPFVITEDAIRLAIQKTIEAERNRFEELKGEYEHDLDTQLELERSRQAEGVEKLKQNIRRLRKISKTHGGEGLLIDRGLDLAEEQIEKFLAPEKDRDN